MINLVGAQLLSLPQGAKPGTAAQLPWPNGSVISARIVPGDTLGSAVLMLGGYRLLAKVPANTPMGNVWLQLINREMPTQFRLLSDFRAATVLSEMLANRIKPQEQAKHEAARAGRGSQETGWQKLDQGQIPYQMEMGADNRRLMLRDSKEGSPRGMVYASSDENYFLLHGRADLGHLGPVAFALEGSGDQLWSLKLYAGKGSSIAELRPAFMQWLEEQRDSENSSPSLQIEGELLGGLPKSVELMGSFHA